MGYSIKMKESVIKKVLMGGKPQREIARDAGIGLSTLNYWLKNHRQKGNVKLNHKEKRPQDWKAEERIKALMKTGAMTAEEKASWCRKQGVFVHHLEQWEKDIVSLAASNNSRGKSKETSSLKKKVSTLEKELFRKNKDLSRKEKALAETAALLVLKKKADSIWGESRDD